MTSIEFCSQLLSLEGSLLKFANRLNLKKDDANDLVQETFLKVLMKKEKYVEDENFKSWTLTIMKNIFVDSYRRNLSRNTHIVKKNESVIFSQAESVSFDDPDSTYSALEITHKIEQLKDKLKAPFKMYIEGFKYNEIADKLNLKIGTVKNRIYLSRKQLMAQLNSKQ